MKDDSDYSLCQLYDRNGEPLGKCHIETRCWCTHTLGQHYSTHCVEGCPCGGDYPPRRPAGKQGFSQAKQADTVCFRCDGAVAWDDALAGKPTLCALCRRILQAKVDKAARDVEFEMVNGSFRKKRPWWRHVGAGLGESMACFALGVFVMVVIHSLGWWP